MIPYKPADDLLTLLLPAAGVLLMLVIAAAVVVWWSRRSGGALLPAGRARRVKLVERLVVSHGTALILVEYDGRPLLVGQSGERLSLLAGGAGAGEKDS